MAEVDPITTGPTSKKVLAAAKACLVDGGYATLSTRRIAEQAGVPLSQIHYHFGSKKSLLLAVLAADNARLLERQAEMYGDDVPLWKRWEQACDFLDEDLASGYVRVLHEMIAAGWSDDEIAHEVRGSLQGWYVLLADVARAAANRFGGLGPLEADDVAVLVGNAFLGSEALILLGFSEGELGSRAALRRVGELIRLADDGGRHSGTHRATRTGGR